MQLQVLLQGNQGVQGTDHLLLLQGLPLLLQVQVQVLLLLLLLKRMLVVL